MNSSTMHPHCNVTCFSIFYPSNTSRSSSMLNLSYSMRSSVPRSAKMPIINWRHCKTSVRASIFFITRPTSICLLCRRFPASPILAYLNVLPHLLVLVHSLCRLRYLYLHSCLLFVFPFPRPLFFFHLSSPFLYSSVISIRFGGI